MKKYFGRIGVLLLFCFFILFFTQKAFAAEIRIIPNSGTYNIGETFDANIFVSSANQSINAVSAIVSFPKDKLEVVSLSKTGTFINFWAQEPAFSNSTGIVSVDGVVLSPGFTGSNGSVVKITFKVKAKGKANIYFSSSSVLANNGEGTNVLNNISQATYTLGPSIPTSSTPRSNNEDAPFAPIIQSRSHPDSTKWYSKRIVELFFDIPADVTAISKKLDQAPTTNPGQAEIPVVKTYKSEELDDGVWYFHLRLKNQYGWGDVSHFRIGIDTTKPEYFSLQEIKQTGIKNPSTVFLLKAEDRLSGVGGFQVQIDANRSIFWNISPDNMYKTDVLPPGSHIALIKVFDNAGNYATDSLDFIIDGLIPPKITEYPSSLKKGDILIVKGVTYHGGNVLVTLKKREDNEEVYIKTLSLKESESEIIKADNEGKFTFIGDANLEAGIYDIYAESVNDEDVKSSPSNIIHILVEDNFLNRLLRWITGTLPVVVVLIIFFITLLAFFIKEWKRHRNIKTILDKEVKITEELISKSFDIINEDLDMLKASQKSSKNKGKNDLLVSQSKRDLEDAEAMLESRVKDIKRQI